MDTSGNSFLGNELSILKYIQDNPGCHLRKIKKEFNVSMGTIQYYLYKLEKNGKITSQRSGLYKYYFPAGIFKDHEKEIIKFLTQETPREILMFIMEQHDPTQIDIAEEIQISPASVKWHLDRLVASNLIGEIKDGKYKRYQLHPEISSLYVVKILRNYYPRIWDRWSNRLVEIFLSISIDRETTKD